MIKNILTRYPLSLITLAAILYLSLLRPPKMDIPTFENADKIAHFCMYAGFCLILWFEYFRSHSGIKKSKIIIWAIIAPIIFSGIMEIAQGLLTKHRSADPYDFLFNILGVVAAALFSNYVTRPIIRKIQRRRNSEQRP